MNFQELLMDWANFDKQGLNLKLRNSSIQQIAKINQFTAGRQMENSRKTGYINSTCRKQRFNGTVLLQIKFKHDLQHEGMHS